jgi:ABC-type phosphate/phosphonate transport system substrate-binding protein
MMMYARAELAGAHQRFWDLLRAELGARGIAAPVDLSNDAPEFEVWEDPTLVFSQTCGMPFRTRLRGNVTLIGTPDYGLEGCAPGYYRSAFVVRADDARQGVAAFKDARFAYNMTISQSGYAAPYAQCRAAGFWFADRLQTGAHHASALAVAEGRADIAALDAVTWRLIRRYDEFADRLRVLEWTTPTPGLPFIAAKGVERGAMFEAIRAAIEGMTQEDRAALGLRGIVEIPEAAYLALSNPPAEVM